LPSDAASDQPVHNDAGPLDRESKSVGLASVGEGLDEQFELGISAKFGEYGLENWLRFWCEDSSSFLETNLAASERRRRVCELLPSRKLAACRRVCVDLRALIRMKAR
jgi:hypothetical protein